MTEHDEYNELLSIVGDIVDAGHMDQEGLARLRAHLGCKPSTPPAADAQKAVAPTWGYAKTVGNAIAQLQTMDAGLPFYAALHLKDGRCIARGVTFSRERVVNERWIDSNRDDVPYSIVVWSQPVESLYTHPSASTSATLTSAAQAVITARDNFGWSPEVDEKINALRSRLATSAAQPLTDAECLTAWEACDETGYLEWTTVVQRAFAEKNGIRLADDAGGEL